MTAARLALDHPELRVAQLGNLVVVEWREVTLERVDAVGRIIRSAAEAPAGWAC